MGVHQGVHQRSILPIPPSPVTTGVKHWDALSPSEANERAVSSMST